jgi:DNA-binding transcriptional LysR family regulator
MELDQLVAFDRIVREGTFGRAALALGIGQPAVSTRIQALERSLGGPLFVRGRRVALTALGEGFLPFARRSLEVLAEGAAAARLARAGKRGRITLGTLGSLAGGLVGPALVAFLRDQPEVECLLRAGEHEQMLGLLLDGVVELAIIAWPPSPAVAADLRRLLLFHEPVVLVAHPRHPLATQRRVTREDLIRLARPLMRLRWWPTHHPELLRLADRAGQKVEIPMETARHLAQAGLGCGFFTRTYVAADLASGSLTEVPVRDLPPLYRDSALVRRSRSPDTPASAHLTAALAATGARLGLLRAGKKAEPPDPDPLPRRGGRGR